MTVTEQIEQVIGEHHGNVRDALNATLARFDMANALLETQREENIMLLAACIKARDYMMEIEQFGLLESGIVGELCAAIHQGDRDKQP